jgi:redox-sensitive bicupin YhaK (pirin superfamily)
MKIVLHKANERGFINHGWLKAAHSFSFGAWYSPEKMHFGMLRVLNDDEIAPHYGFDEHPHDNMEIITLVQEGVLKHKDNMDNELLMHPNDVQVMSAGSGIFHSETNPSNQITRLFQIWVFPNKINVVPRYEQKTFLPENRKNTWQEIIKPYEQKEGDGIFIYQQAWFCLCDLDNQKSITYTSKMKGNGAYVFVIDGEIEIENVSLSNRDAVGIEEYSEFKIFSNSNSRLLVIDVPMNR